MNVGYGSMNSAGTGYVSNTAAANFNVCSWLRSKHQTETFIIKFLVEREKETIKMEIIQMVLIYYVIH